MRVFDRHTTPWNAGAPVKVRHTASPRLQAKLTVGAPNDEYEREADRVAQQVIHGAGSPDLMDPVPRTAAPRVQRACACGGTCDSCREDEETVRRSPSSADLVATEAPEDVHQTLSSPGRLLDPAVRERLEPRFAMDFSRVRIHTDSRAAASARAVSARAYTVGPQIVFAPGQYAPGTATGDRLLAHELTHVVQQSGSGAVLQRQPAKKTDSELAAEIGNALEEDAISAKALTVLNGLAMDQMLRVLEEFLKLQTEQTLIVLLDHPLDRLLRRMPSGLGDEAEQRIRVAIASVRAARARRRGAKDEEVKKLQQEVKTLGAGLKHADQKEVIRKHSLASKTGTYGMFPDKTPTSALARWNYLVYPDHIRLGNRSIGNQQVIGSLPWMTNNPGDITVDVTPPKNRKQNTKAYDLGAFRGVAARTDLAIFPDLQTGYSALRKWIMTEYKGMTVAAAVSKHLGPASTHTAVDDPDKYAKMVQEYLDRNSGLKLNVYTKVINDKLDPAELDWIAKAMGYAEGLVSVKGVLNIGVIYRCNGRDAANDAAMETWKANHSLVKALPSAAPDEVKALLGCF